MSYLTPRGTTLEHALEFLPVPLSWPFDSCNEHICKCRRKSRVVRAGQDGLAKSIASEVPKRGAQNVLDSRPGWPLSALPPKADMSSFPPPAFGEGRHGSLAPSVHGRTSVSQSVCFASPRSVFLISALSFVAVRARSDKSQGTV